jgi:hypothetical protein
VYVSKTVSPGSGSVNGPKFKLPLSGKLLKLKLGEKFVSPENTGGLFTGGYGFTSNLKDNVLLKLLN